MSEAADSVQQVLDRSVQRAMDRAKDGNCPCGEPDCFGPSACPRCKGPRIHASIQIDGEEARQAYCPRCEEDEGDAP